MRELDVLGHAQVRQNGQFLMHDRDAAGPRLPALLAFDVCGPCRAVRPRPWSQNPGDDLQKSGLPGAVASEQSMDLLRARRRS